MVKRKHNRIVDPAYIQPNNYIGQLYAIKDRGDILFRGYSTNGPLLGWVKEEDVYFIRDMDGPLYAQVIEDDIIFRSRSKTGRIWIMVEIPFWNRVAHRFSQNNVHYDEYETIVYAAKKHNSKQKS